MDYSEPELQQLDTTFQRVLAGLSPPVSWGTFLNMRYPLQCVRSTILQLSPENALEVLSQVIEDCSAPIARAISCFVSHNLRLLFCALPPNLLELLSIDSSLSVPTRLSVPIHLRLYQAALLEIRSAQSTPALDLNNDSIFHTWLSETSSGLQELHELGQNLPWAVRYHLARHVHSAPLHHAIQAMRAFSDVGCPTLYDQIHWDVMHTLETIANRGSYTSDSEAPHLEPAPRARLLFQHLLPLLGPAPYPAHLIAALRHLFFRLGLTESWRLLPHIEALLQPALWRSVQRMFQNRVQLHAIGILMDPDWQQWDRSSPPPTTSPS
jgi:hypothetical protein